MSSYWKDLIVWQKCHSLVRSVYKILEEFPGNEKYILTDQIKRASISIPTNIVEGHSKSSKKEFTRFLFISRGSLEELRYLVLLSKDLNLLTTIPYEGIEKQCMEISYMLNKLIQSLKP